MLCSMALALEQLQQTSWLLHIIQVAVSSTVAPLHYCPTHPQPHTFPYLFRTLSLMGTMEFHLPKLALAQGYVPSLTSSKVSLPQTVLKLKQSHPLLCQHSHKQFKKKQKKMTGFFLVDTYSYLAYLGIATFWVSSFLLSELRDHACLDKQPNLGPWERINHLVLFIRHLKSV